GVLRFLCPILQEYIYAELGLFFPVPEGIGQQRAGRAGDRVGPLGGITAGERARNPSFSTSSIAGGEDGG
ncbi:MAG: hypothetical protein ACK53L_08180, partial [Pirellulaceae bacterium]